MSSFPSKDEDKMDEMVKKFFSTSFYKKGHKKKESKKPEIRYGEIEELKFRKKDFDKERLVDIFNFKHHSEIIIDLRDFKKKDINYNMINNVLTVFDNSGKYFKEIKFRRNRKVSIAQGSFHKGILRIKVIIKNI